MKIKTPQPTITRRAILFAVLAYVALHVAAHPFAASKHQALNYFNGLVAHRGAFQQTTFLAGLFALFLSATMFRRTNELSATRRLVWLLLALCLSSGFAAWTEFYGYMHDYLYIHVSSGGEMPVHDFITYANTIRWGTALDTLGPSLLLIGSTLAVILVRRSRG